MKSFTFGFWTGFVAGVVFAALAQQNRAEITMEEKLLDLPGMRAETPAAADMPAQRPASLAEALAQNSQT